LSASDPRAPGAAAHAPPGLEAQSSADRARFLLRGPWQPIGQQQVTVVIVTQATVHFGAVQVGWSEVARADLVMGEQGPLLALLDADERVVAAAPCVGTADDAWLAEYLQGHVERRGLTASDRARFDEEAAGLRRLLDGRT